MRRALLVGLVAWWSVVSAPAQEDYGITRTVMLPRTTYVGDRVELRVEIRPSGSVSIAAPDSMPQAPWAEFHDIQLLPRGNEYELRLVLTPYQPGTLTLPPIELGEIVLRELSVHVSSVLAEGEAEPSPPHRQAVLPYTRILLGGAAAVLLLVPMGLFVIARWGRGRLEQILRAYRTRKPYRRLLKTLRALESRIEEIDARGFYIDLLQELRRYFSQKLHRDLMSATTAEIAVYMRQAVAQAEDREALFELFHYGDLVKFASRRSRLGERRTHIEELRGILDRIERSSRFNREHAVEEESHGVGA